MQYNNPFENQFYNNTPYFSTPAASNPEVIGEGDVSSLLYPDGSTQYYFQPRNFHISPNIYKNNYVWIIRSISGSQFNQPIPIYTQSQSVPMDQSYLPEPYPLKFHNDGWTSTTDLHYFFPRLRQSEWVPKLGAAVQVELPTESANIYHYQIIPDTIKIRENRSNSPMAIDAQNNSTNNKKDQECNTNNVICSCGIEENKLLTIKDSKEAIRKKISTSKCNMENKSKISIKWKDSKCQCKDCKCSNNQCGKKKNKDGRRSIALRSRPRTKECSCKYKDKSKEENSINKETNEIECKCDTCLSSTCSDCSECGN